MENLPKTLTFNQTVNVLKNHGISLNQQTGVHYGPMGTVILMDKGTSFNEAFGIKEEYNTKQVMEWLGY